MTRRLVLPPEFRRRIIEHALAERPNECVGLLAGHVNVVERVYPLPNEANTEWTDLKCMRACRSLIRRTDTWH